MTRKDLRIVERTYDSGEVKYVIQFKTLFGWVEGYSSFDSLEKAKQFIDSRFYKDRVIE